MTGPRRLRCCCLAVLAFLGLEPAWAHIYSFTDASGQAHFSNVPQDKRYTVFLRQPRAVAGPVLKARAAPDERIPRLLHARRGAYSAQVAGLASALKVDAALLHAVITAESAYNPKARSNKGAMGLMQLMPGTARRYCVSDPFDPIQNLHGGSRYLRDLLQRYNHDPRLALAAYNAGEDAVARHGNRIPPYRETQRYVPLVMGFYEQYRRAPELMAVSSGDVARETPARLDGRCG